MSKPRRIQRSRAKGWRMPPGAVYVGRPTRWGNPFPMHGEWITWAAVAAGFRADAAGRRAAAVAYHRAWLTGDAPLGPLAATDSGDRIEYASGAAASTATAARGIAWALATSIGLAPPEKPSLAELRAALRGHDLACWCPLDQPCHADVLLEMANA